MAYDILTKLFPGIRSHEQGTDSSTGAPLNQPANEKHTPPSHRQGIALCHKEECMCDMATD